MTLVVYLTRFSSTRSLKFFVVGITSFKNCRWPSEECTIAAEMSSYDSVSSSGSGGTCCCCCCCCLCRDSCVSTWTKNSVANAVATNASSEVSIYSGSFLAILCTFSTGNLGEHRGADAVSLPLVSLFIVLA
ncbi:hypothetical protein WN66_03501 [Saccharomyces cerevisiae]|uniref:Putative uncharacterized protein YJL064W n=2 Tax=Saccharomyces cerevisiae TaxID=4932 RepID=YJG4_YEAST|nr:RecName: Full=Putative uncharacterized protein YJL064W [Saccharomyces cerevisiae S288C]KZV10209.1 hypothetical protein WN66_03501 [Saccharomyces cerevisiae]WNV73338.1 hypothetical protein O6U65_1240 [Saccharomyces cerevisiae synthetic construct]CAY80715.2 EC1118_1J11_1871p [Saccharomyces cerevisiae EC1118]CAA84058.1 HRC131 [Saccharomyces cerevisiae]CAA89356.1 unnamed protein product [Saccharomyces cerevisiae]